MLSLVPLPRLALTSYNGQTSSCGNGCPRQSWHSALMCILAQALACGRSPWLRFCYCTVLSVHVRLPQTTVRFWIATSNENNILKGQWDNLRGISVGLGKEEQRRGKWSQFESDKALEKCIVSWVWCLQFQQLGVLGQDYYDSWLASATERDFLKIKLFPELLYII